ncbi:hypothetical protein GCM10010170_058780 [Dactylosporangium salmoneum]|uniref:Integrase catalytic domain-containing protein n=1 Tax=Dactylosporangium salmoneum TaxID=53361 RepID=A0ABP5TV55_9ACTN
MKACEAVFGEPVSVHLTLALDVYMHSPVAFRLTLVSDTPVDMAMLLRDVMMPLPMRPEWGEDLEWPYPGVPAAVVAEFAGHRVAGLPFFTPETITTDHSAVYKNHHRVEVQRVIGANILPARVLRPTDKQAVERAFGAIQSLLLELVGGHIPVEAWPTPCRKRRRPEPRSSSGRRSSTGNKLQRPALRGKPPRESAAPARFPAAPTSSAAAAARGATASAMSL